MIEFEVETNGTDDCASLGARLSGLLRAGDILLLDGPLGAGKTTLVRSIAEGMGIPGSNVSSPTFVVMNEYENPEGPDLVHVDAYRMHGDDEEELQLLGWDRVVDPGDAVVVVEWAERVRSLLDATDRIATVVIETTGETDRVLRFSVPDAWASRRGLGVFQGEGMHNADNTGTDTRTDTICPTTGVAVPADSPTWPFADERARMADLYKWFSGSYNITRPIEQADLEQGE